MHLPEPLYIIIPDFNGWQQTRVCLRELQQSSFAYFKIIVVDHGTEDTTAAGLAEFPSCIHVRGNPDLWWTGATNLGIREALHRGARYLVLLNNDCYVDATTLAHLARHLPMAAPQVIAPVQRDAATGEVVVASAGTCFTLGFPTMVMPGMRRLPASTGALLSTKLIIGGRGVVIPAEVFDTVGLFDEESLPHYGADHDFYLRCRKEGIPLFVASDADVRIDTTRTSLAGDPGAMTWAEFKASLMDMRSHRNLAALRTLFQRHYPVSVLYPVGVFLNLGRYFLSYLAHKLTYRLRRID